MISTPNLRVLGVQVAHDERDDVHGAAAHGAGEAVRADSPSSRPGSIQLLVNPASCSFSEQMKVRSSTRATSAGSENAAKEFGNLSSASSTAAGSGLDQLGRPAGRIPPPSRPPNTQSRAASVRRPPATQAEQLCMCSWGFRHARLKNRLRSCIAHDCSLLGPVVCIRCYGPPARPVGGPTTRLVRAPSSGCSPAIPGILDVTASNM